jgi:hypothetical protein
MASPVAWRIVPAMEETLFDISDLRPWKRQPSYCSSLSPMRNFVAQSHPYHVPALGDVDKDLRVVYGNCGTGDVDKPYIVPSVLPECSNAA